MSRDSLTMSLTVSKKAIARGLIAVALLGGGYFVGAQAAIPADSDALVYSGVLEENGVLVNVPRTIAIELHATATGTGAGDVLCRTAPGEDVEVRGGRFRITLDESCASVVRANADVFVEVQVDGSPVGARTKLGAVPFAVVADRAATAEFAETASAAATGSALAEILAEQPIITPWAPYTPEFRSDGTVVTSGHSTVGFFRRVGDPRSHLCPRGRSSSRG